MVYLNDDRIIHLLYEVIVLITCVKKLLFKHACTAN